MTKDRYARHHLVPGWQQARLAQARVIIAGIGALGNEVARLLALSGVGHLLLCDPDRVEPTNLSRTTLFHEADLGHNKAQAAIAPLARLGPGAQLEARPATLIHGIGLGELAAADLVISCLDSHTARLQLAGRCNLVRAPLLDGGTHAWGGEVRPYLDPDGPCYGCGLSPNQRARSDQAASCGQTNTGPQPATAVVSASVGAAMATAAVRHLMDLPVLAQTLVIEAATGQTRMLARGRDPDCPLHQPLPAATPILLDNTATIGQLRAHLEPGAHPLLWAPPPGSEDPTNLETAHLPETQTLAETGIPPGEILAVETADRLHFIALATDEQKKYPHL